MSGANSFKFVLLPPQSDTTRDWAKRLADMVPETRVVVAEDAATAAREIVDAEAAFGWLGGDLLSKATRLRWLQAPQAARASQHRGGLVLRDRAMRRQVLEHLPDPRVGELLQPSRVGYRAVRRRGGGR